jgi:hypothetical protein
VYDSGSNKGRKTEYGEGRNTLSSRRHLEVRPRAGEFDYYS